MFHNSQGKKNSIQQLHESMKWITVVQMPDGPFLCCLEPDGLEQSGERGGGCTVAHGRYDLMLPLLSRSMGGLCLILYHLLARCTGDLCSCQPRLHPAKGECNPKSLSSIRAVKVNYPKEKGAVKEKNRTEINNNHAYQWSLLCGETFSLNIWSAAHKEETVFEPPRGEKGGIHGYYAELSSASFTGGN